MAPFSAREMACFGAASSLQGGAAMNRHLLCALAGALALLLPTAAQAGDCLPYTGHWNF